MHLVLLIIIYFKIKFKKLISKNNFSLFYQLVPKRGGGNLKANLIEPPYKILCFLWKVGHLEPLTLPATVVSHGYLMIRASYLVFLPLLFLLIFVGSGSLSYKSIGKTGQRLMLLIFWFHFICNHVVECTGMA